MRTGVVWIVAAVCGLVTFGSTLVTRAPEPARPAPPASPASRSERSAMASDLLPRSLAELEAEVLGNPESFRARWSLAQRQEYAGMPEEARQSWAEARKSARATIDSPEPSHMKALAWFVLGEATRALGDPDGARACFENSIRLYRERLEGRAGDAAIMYRMGWCARRLGDEAAALKHWHAAAGAYEERLGWAGIRQLYMMACARALVADEGRAVEAIEMLLERGWQDGELLERAPEFEAIRGGARFRRVMERVEAEESARRALRPSGSAGASAAPDGEGGG